MARSHSLAGVLPLPVMLLVGTACDRGLAAEPVIGELEEVAKAYSIEVVTADPGCPMKTTHGTIDGRRADEKSLREYVRLFAPEFSLYPADLVRRTRLKRVVLCRDLSFAGQRRNAIPDWEGDTLYLDVSRGAYDQTYLRKVIHHEFFHIIDYRDDRNVYRDERWASLNAADFRYGSGGRAAQDLQKTAVLTTRYPGFLNHYSTTGVEEDKAEVFATLVVEFAYVEDRATRDRVLRAKVERMKELLVEFCPEAGDKFWAKVRAAKRADR